MTDFHPGTTPDKDLHPQSATADFNVFEQPKIDCHCHIFDPEHFPYTTDTAYRPSGGEISTADYFSHVLAAYGVQHALLVQPNSGYGSDNRCMLDAIHRGKGTFKGIAIASHDTSDSELADLKAQGIVGIAHNVAMLGEAYYAQYDALWKRLAKAGMFVQVQVAGDQMARLAPRLKSCEAQILVDHHGRPDISAGISAPGFQALLDLAKTARCYVKLSGYDKFSEQAFPFSDAEPFTQALFEAFGPDHCLWASDWPHLRAVRRLDYGVLARLLQKVIPDDQARARIFYETPKRIFGFEK